MGGMDWIDLVKGSDMWQTLLNAVFSFWFHKMQGIT
jgi:hypothetical protein